MSWSEVKKINSDMSKPLDERQMIVQISKILNQHRKELA